MQEHMNLIEVPEGYTVVSNGLKALGSRRGLDTDIHYYDVVNAAGEVVASYEVSDHTSIHPPFGRTFDVAKVR